MFSIYIYYIRWAHHIRFSFNWRCPIRNITGLSIETLSMLKRIYKYSIHHLVRQRAHCILLSYQGYTAPQLAEIFSVTLRTIYNWLNDWESDYLIGLYDAAGRGAKTKLLPAHESIIKHWINAFPKDINKVRLLVQEMLGVCICIKTLQRFLKRIQFSWRRIRKKVNGKPDPLEYKQKKKQLNDYEIQVLQGDINLVYGDQSGFCLTPYVPYAWQEKGQTIQIKASHSKRLNVFGLLNRTNNTLTAYTIESTMNSQTIIACIDTFCKTIKKKTVLVLDQAPFHTSKKVKQKIKKWKEKGLTIFFLPKCSPHLNPIEILWRFMKYEWIEFDAYLSWNKLVQYVEKVIRNYGSKYEINFV